MNIKEVFTKVSDTEVAARYTDKVIQKCKLIKGCTDSPKEILMNWVRNHYERVNKFHAARLPRRSQAAVSMCNSMYQVVVKECASMTSNKTWAYDIVNYMGYDDAFMRHLDQSIVASMRNLKTNGVDPIRPLMSPSPFDLRMFEFGNMSGYLSTLNDEYGRQPTI